MSGLIDNVMDFARGRLGDGIAIEKKYAAPLTSVVQQIIDENHSVSPDRTITTRFGSTAPISCDRLRIAQLFSNLLANAITHGGDDPIFVWTSDADGMFELSVENTGTLSPEAMPNLFRPFARGEAHSSRRGLGLGLYIA